MFLLAKKINQLELIISQLAIMTNSYYSSTQNK